jgi:hypothetical protein
MCSSRPFHVQTNASTRLAELRRRGWPAASDDRRVGRGFAFADGSNDERMANTKRTGDASADVEHPLRTHDKLEQAEEYQAPRRGKEKKLVDRATRTEADDPVEITVVESKQQRPGLQTSETVESGQDSSPVPTVSGKG